MGSTHPYYRRSKPKPQNEKDFMRDISLRQIVQRLRDQGKLPLSTTISVKDLIQRFQPVVPGSVRSLLEMFAGDGGPIDFSNPDVHLAAFDEVDAVVKANARFDARVAAVLRAVVGPRSLNSFWPQFGPATSSPGAQRDQEERLILSNFFYAGLLDIKTYYDSEVNPPPVLSPTTLCLAILAYPDFFSPSGLIGQSTISRVIVATNPGWCGTFGPGIDGAVSVANKKIEGNYDMVQMHLLPMAYRFYDELTPDAREHLITELLAKGRIHGPGQEDTFTFGPYPDYWSRAGMVSPLGIHTRIGETENHILMIMTARYLTNQLLYQRGATAGLGFGIGNQFCDNRRNSPSELQYAVFDRSGVVAPGDPNRGPSPGSCTFLLLDLLQRILRNDFSEYNAKNYQKETRWALLNLCSYAYDHEIRLAARMVLDYLSAHFAVSSNDLRRLVPFRRRNESPKNNHDPDGFMTCGILDWQDGADTMGPVFAILAGNMRAYEDPHPSEPDYQTSLRDHRSWSIRRDGDDGDQVIDALSDYRIPPAIHDLFVNDRHRRFYQRLHRHVRPDEDEVGGNRNCDNMELYAGSPSYLITAGGSPATFAIDPYFLGVPLGDYDQQRGVAVTTTFMPTTYSQKVLSAVDLIQFSSFSDFPAWNYGVAPDFACGHQIHLPDWVRGNSVLEGKFTFVSQKAVSTRPGRERPGFFLAIYQENGFALLEALDTWLYPEVKFDDFKSSVKDRNQNLILQNNVVTSYQTWNGNQFDFVIWDERRRFQEYVKGPTMISAFLSSCRHEAVFGAEVLNLKYSNKEPRDAYGDAGKVTDQLVNGTVMNSKGDAIVEIMNHDLRTKITLDMSDLVHPKRIVETETNIEVEQAGFNHEVWVDFDWAETRAENISKSDPPFFFSHDELVFVPIPSEGDFFRPFNTIAAAIAAVADGGVIKIMPGSTSERLIMPKGKRITITAPIGGVTIGIR